MFTLCQFLSSLCYSCKHSNDASVLRTLNINIMQIKKKQKFVVLKSWPLRGILLFFCKITRSYEVIRKIRLNHQSFSKSTLGCRDCKKKLAKTQREPTRSYEVQPLNINRTAAATEGALFSVFYLLITVF